MLYKELTEKKNELVTRSEEILGKAKEEKRELTEDELRYVYAMIDEVDCGVG